MHAVIVPGREVDRGKTTAIKITGPAYVATQQVQRAEAAPFRLQQTAMLDVANLADDAIHRAKDIGAGQRTCSISQRACEKVIETGVASVIGLFRLVHLHAEYAYEGRNSQIN